MSDILILVRAHQQIATAVHTLGNSENPNGPISPRIINLLNQINLPRRIQIALRIKNIPLATRNIKSKSLATLHDIPFLDQSIRNFKSKPDLQAMREQPDLSVEPDKDAEFCQLYFIYVIVVYCVT